MSADAELLRVFDENARTYDRVNSVVSLGLDRRWREWVAARAVRQEGDRVLDAFGGTGTSALPAAERGAQVTLADASRGMMTVAEERARRRNLRLDTALVDLTSDALPWPGACFDAITVVFGVRYLDEPSEVLGRLATLLAPGGRLVLLEFVTPRRGLVAQAAAAYFFHLLPDIASLLAGSGRLYSELTATTRRMDGPERVVSIAEQAGLGVEELKVMGFGLVVGAVCTPANPAVRSDETRTPTAVTPV